MEFCKNCFRPERQHALGRCPGFGTHVDINANTVARAKTTGHPHLVAAMINNAQEGVLTDVYIERLRVLEKDQC